MKLRTFISSARKAQDRNTIIKRVKKYCEMSGIELPSGHEENNFDCNEDDSTLRDTPKQEEYNKQIKESTDLFIAILNANYIGKYTVYEIKTAYESYCQKGFPICMIFDKQKPDVFPKKEEDYTREQLLDELNEICHKYNKQHDYTSKELTQKIKTIPPIMEANEIDEATATIPHFFIDYIEERLETEFTDEVSKLMKNGRFWLRQYTKSGKDVTSLDILGDERGSVSRGFLPDVYFKRNYIDSKLLKQAFTLIKGKPGAGKSRAILNLINEQLKNNNIVLIRNLNDFNRVFTTLFRQEQGGHYKLQKFYMAETYYFVMDEIDKLITVYGKGDESFPDKFKIFIREIYDGRFYALCTTTLEGYSQIEDYIDATKSTLLTIEPLNKNRIEDRRIIQYFTAHSNSLYRGDTVGSLIPALQNYIVGIINPYKEHFYAKQFFIAYHIINKYRTNSRSFLFLTLIVMRVRFMSQHKEFDSELVQKLLTELIQKGIIYISDKSKKIESGDAIEFDYDTSSIFDDEEIITIVDKRFTLAFDDILWEYISEQDYIKGIPEEKQINILVKSFPYSETYCKSITRSSNKIQAWKYIKKTYEQKVMSDENITKENKMFFKNILIEYAPTIEEAICEMEEAQKHSFVPDSSTIAGLYTHYLKEKTNLVHKQEILQQIQNIEKNIILTEYCNFYHLRKIQLASSYTEAKAHFDTYKASIDSFKSPNKSDIDLEDTDKIYLALSAKTETIEEFYEVSVLIKERIRYHNNQHLERPEKLYINMFDLERIIAHYANNEKQLDYIYHLIMDATDLLEPFELDEYNNYLVGNLIKHAANFNMARKFYNYLEPHQINSWHLSQLFNKCDKEKDLFSDMLSILEDAKKKMNTDANTLVYNVLIKKAPTYEDALIIIKKLKYVDNYTLNQFLDIIKEQIKRDSKKDKSQTRYLKSRYFKVIKENFITDIDANGDIINHSENRNQKSTVFAGVKVDAYTLSSLYHIALPEDWKWIEELTEKSEALKKSAYNNIIIYTVRILNAQDFPQSLDEFYKYEAALLDHNDEESLFEPDCFTNLLNAFQRKSQNSDKYKDVVDKILKKYNTHIDKDRFFYGAYYLAFADRIFIPNTFSFTPEFLKDVEYPKLDSYFFNQLLFHGKLNFQKRKTIFEHEMKLYSKTNRKTLFPNEHTIRALFEAVEKMEEFNYIVEQIKRYNIFVDRILYNNLSKFAENNKIDFDLKRPEKKFNLIEQSCHSIKKATSCENIFDILRSYLFERQQQLDTVILNTALQKIAELGKSFSVRQKHTYMFKNFLHEKEIAPFIHLTLISYNSMLQFYYPEEEKLHLLEEMKQHGYKPDAYTYVSLMTDTACSIKTNRKGFECLKADYGRTMTSQSYNSYLKQELLYSLRSKEQDFTCILNILNEMMQHQFRVDYFVYQRIKTECINSNNAMIKEEFNLMGKTQEFLFRYMMRFLDDEQLDTLYQVALFNGIEL